MTSNNFNIKGLTDEQVASSREKYGKNVLAFKQESGFWVAVKSLIKEPMVVLLLLASTIYFVSGKVDDGIFLVSAVILVAIISLYQDSRSRNALEKLKSFTQPFCKAIRNGQILAIKSEELVVGDYLVVEEGTMVAADGEIVHSNDFSVDESILTGESLSVSKHKTSENNGIYMGTTVATGLAIARITAIGNATKLGEIGKSLEEIEVEKTPLERQIARFVKIMVIVGGIVFVLVWSINFWRTQNMLESLLKALTLAMSILPEEIPVAFTTFMALGAWRLMKMGIVVKQMKTVETLGSATVICTDKTGTITENRMSIAKLFSLKTLQVTAYDGKIFGKEEKELIETAMWASEPIPFDTMEVALHDAYAAHADIDERVNFHLSHEYPLSGKPPMMTHIFSRNNGQDRIIAAKGAPEAMIAVSHLTEHQKSQIQQAIVALTNESYRVLGVGVAPFEGDNFPEKQQDFRFELLGLVAFYDPPKQNIGEVLEHFYNAGIKVKIITGDNAATTISIAKKIGFRGYEKSITGEELMALDDAALRIAVMETNLFTRMFPEAKLSIIQALKANNEIVAMTGDGVNDGPALKAAHIGIAMGKKGTEIAKQAASLILVEDDLSKMVDAIGMGRKIYANLKKAIQYVISIHIPIVLMVFLPLALGWIYPNIFSPMHVIFMELIMGPTCSIIYENEPIEKNTMLQKPKPFTTTFFNWSELSTSIAQGLAITIGTLFIYVYAVQNDYNEALTRAMVFATLLVANIILTLVNRSFYYSIWTTMQYKNNHVVLIIGITLGILALLLFVKPFTLFFELEQPNSHQLFLCTVVGIAAVIWFELVKWANRWQKTD